MYSKADAFIVCTCTQVHTPVHSHWYDRQKLIAKEIHNTQYVSCMNPTAGSFTINPRLQRHFCVLAISFPGENRPCTASAGCRDLPITAPIVDVDDADDVMLWKLHDDVVLQA